MTKQQPRFKVSFVVDSEELADLRQAARREGLAVSDYAREQVLHWWGTDFLPKLDCSDRADYVGQVSFSEEENGLLPDLTEDQIAQIGRVAGVRAVTYIAAYRWLQSHLHSVSPEAISDAIFLATGKRFPPRCPVRRLIAEARALGWAEEPQPQHFEAIEVVNDPDKPRPPKSKRRSSKQIKEGIEP